MLERPKKIIFKTKGAKKNIMGAKNVNILVGENQTSYSRINGSGNDFVDNLDMMLHYQCMVTDFKEIQFKYDNILTLCQISIDVIGSVE
jgi:hypothetical protein